MQKFKILSNCIIAAMLMLILAACGTTQQPSETPTSAAEKEIIIAYSQAELVNAWRVTNQKDMENQAQKLGVKLISADANQDPAKQLADVENMLAQKPDVLIVSPLEAEASAPVVEMAEKASVPLIVIDRNIDAEPGKGIYITEITQSHVFSGRLLAEKAVELLTAKYGEPRGNVVHVQGIAGASPVIDANQGWDEVMVDYPDIKVIATTDAGFTEEGGLKVMEEFLQKFPKGDIDIVRSDYSAMTMGALEAIKNAGRDELLGYVMGEGGHIRAIEAVIEGEIARETQTPPYFGEKAIKNALAILNDIEVPAYQQVDIKVFDADDKDFAQEYLAGIKAAGLEF